MMEFAGLPSVQALAWTLVHFLWQGALIGGAAALLLGASGRASTRYTIGIAALVAMLVMPVVTFFALLELQLPVLDLSRAGGSLQQFAGRAALPALLSVSDTAATAESGWWPAVGVFGWVAGMLVLSVRLAGGWIVARRMATHAVRPAADHIQAVARSLAKRLALGRAVQVLESSAVAVPVLVGWLRPAVVFPVAALAGLSPVQIEALLAHELAHVRRHDYLVNLLQSFAEIVLFYHPAVWWLSRRIRTERELCCDDLAVGLCDRLVYATALTDLAAMRSPRVALAATGGDLLTRVRRILEREDTPMTNTRWIPALIISALILAVVPVALASMAPAREQAAAPMVIVTPEAVAEAVAPGSAEASALAVRDAVAPEAVAESPAQQSREADALAARLRALEVEIEAARSQLAQDQNAVQAAVLAERLEELVRQQSVDELRKNLARMQRMFDVGLASQGQLDEARTALNLVEAGGDQQRRSQIEAEELERRLADARRRFEVGLVSKDEVARIESALAQSRLNGRARDIERSVAEQVERRRREVNDQVERQSRATGARADQERRLNDLTAVFEQQSRAYEQELGRARAEAATSEQRRAVAPDRMRDVVPDRAREVAPESRAYEPVASRPIVAGDLLFLSIEGESELPSIYRIDGNGAIRVPLLGTFKVTGQTPGQVREAIGRKLMDAKLGSPAKVTVELRQAREARRVR